MMKKFNLRLVAFVTVGLLTLFVLTTVGQAFAMGMAEGDVVTLAGPDANLPATFTPPVIDGLIDDAYTSNPNSVVQEYCDANGDVLARMYTTYDVNDPNYSSVYGVLEMSLALVDNTYGANIHPSWTAAGKTTALDKLRGSDKAQVNLYDSTGTLLYSPLIDYVQDKQSTPSTWGSAGISGGDGRANGLDPAYFQGATSIDYNLNHFCTSGIDNCTINGVNLKQDSPPVDQYYAPTDPTFAAWEYRYLYEFAIDRAAFGSNGYGHFDIPFTHVSPNKIGDNEIPVTPCTGSIGDRVWQDSNLNGVQDAGESGLNGVQVQLYRDNGDGSFDANSDYPVSSQTTTGDGDYDFTGLGPGTYFVDVIDATVPAGYVLTTANDPTSAITLTSGQDYNDADFGYSTHPDLALSKVLSSGDPGVVGDEIVFTIFITNTGQSDIAILPLQDYYDPAKLSFMGATPASDDNNDDGVLDWSNLGPLVSGQSLSVELRFQAIDLTSGGAALSLNSARALGTTSAEPVVDGLLEDSYIFVKRTDPGADAPGNLYQYEGASVCYYAFVVDRAFNDNVYADKNLDNAYMQLDGWTSNHEFKKLRDSDHAIFDISYTGGSFTGLTLDYLKDTGGGTWDSGQTGGDGSDAPGTPPIDAARTSLHWNLENSGWDGGSWGDPLKHSPSYNYNDDISHYWEWAMIYEFSIPKSEMNGACGSVDLGGAHNSPAKSDGTSLGSIGDYVWNDANSNGLQDESAAGFPNVTVNLYESGSLIRTTQTEPGTTGYYIFSNLPAGTDVVDVDESTLPAGAQLTTGNEPLTVNLSSGEQFMTADFGYSLGNGSIGDLVYYDLNRNGLADAGEPGLAGVTVNLYEGTCAAPGSLLRSAVTTGSGFYDFTSLPPAAYCVDVDENTLPAGVQLTSGNEPLTVNLALDEDYNDADFGYAVQEPGRTCDLASVTGAEDVFGAGIAARYDAACVEILSGATIGDYVWNDANGNGLQDEAAGLGINDVVINLYRDDGNGTFEPNVNDTWVMSQTTAGDGAYLFTNLLPGDYWVDVDESTLAAGYEFIPGTQSGPEPHLLSLAVGQHYTAADFGYAGRGNIAGTVFYDWNEDGQQGLGEDGIPGVEVCLHPDVNGNGQIDPEDSTVLECQQTDAQGAYNFTGYLPGHYLIIETQPPDLIDTTPNYIARELIVVGPSGNAVDNNFGEVLYGSIGDMVYLDSNGNGTQDPGENLGVYNVPVSLYNVSTGVTTTMMTDVNGLYLFMDLPAGTYIVSTPASLSGMQRTSASPLTVYLGNAEDYLDADFGYITPTDVALADLSASRTSKGTLIQWRTAFEQDATGFVVWRAVAENGVYKPVSGLIPASNLPGGSSYQWLDTTVDSSTTYWYKIESRPDGALFGPVSAVPEPGDGGQILFIPLVVR